MKIPICFYYDLGASSALLLRSCRFCCESRHFDQNFEFKLKRRTVEWGCKRFTILLPHPPIPLDGDSASIRDVGQNDANRSRNGKSAVEAPWS